MIASPFIVSLLTLVAVVGAQTQYSCPADSGKTMVVNSKKYELKCSKGVKGMPFEEESSANIGACLQRCAANPECLHCTFVDKTKKCGLKKEGEVFDNAALATWFFVEKVTDSGPVDNNKPPGDNTQPGDSGQKPIGGNESEEDPENQASYSCPVDQDKRYVASNGKTYELKCNTGHSQGHWRSQPCPTLKECASRCAAESQCFSADFSEAQNVCSFKKAPVITVESSGIHTWWPTECPKIRQAQATVKPLVTTNLTCPQNDGKIFEGSDGTWFYLQCCSDADGAVILDYKVSSSHKECSEECVKNKQCKSFMFIPGMEPEGGHANCRLYTNGNFSTTKIEGMHYAFVTDPPTKDAELSDAKRCSTECPSADGQLFVSPTGENFIMSCNARHGTTVLKTERRPSFEACMASCAAMPACQSADYEPRTKKCFFGNNTKRPNITAGAFLSAHSLGCSGACAGCKKGCDQVGNNAMAADMASCPGDDGKLLAAAGQDFRLYCSHCFRSSASGHFLLSGAKNLGECAKACAEEPRCHGVNWMAEKGCNAHPERDSAGVRPQFGQDGRCHALAPLDRSMAELETLQKF
ncbi:PAN domain-containing protein [Plectosphaerella plurivora]|uniref:PAN domain-containing protein n=1 Tax=Plectosphaerella plurivora TaxID=936078 RepID=A0A9P8V3A2_9PEZI|nr:PAN domain-containing protein [Plectosphaerella plurivora]